MTKPTKQQAKKERQENIEKFMYDMTEKNISLESLDKILEKLKERGIKASRATIDRDLDELGFVKIGGSYVYQPPEDAEEQERRYRKEKFLRTNLIDGYFDCEIFPIKAVSGTGNGVASRLRSLFSELILGTVADDNMVLVITKKEGNASKIYDEIKNIKKSKKEKNPPIASISADIVESENEEHSCNKQK